jgi:hypothetical protein
VYQKLILYSELVLVWAYYQVHSLAESDVTVTSVRNLCDTGEFILLFLWGDT